MYAHEDSVRVLIIASCSLPFYALVLTTPSEPDPQTKLKTNPPDAANSISLYLVCYALALH